VSEKESGDDADDELPCVIRGERQVCNSVTGRLTA